MAAEDSIDETKNEILGELGRVLSAGVDAWRILGRIHRPDSRDALSLGPGRWKLRRGSLGNIELHRDEHNGRSRVGSPNRRRDNGYCGGQPTGFGFTPIEVLAGVHWLRASPRKVDVLLLIGRDSAN